ncbi:MAG TPA: prolyl oligopeptidase family serine peptidase [Bryobacteraceae bacterium]|nr:prolyl oligopeptidase family serine peptidase [Bryobacteraceae bacterium]
MNSTMILTTLALCVAAPAFAQMPPLVDRDLYFGEVEISGAQISPDGKFISFLKPLNGTRNVWVKKAEEPFSAAKPVTAETKRPIPGYFWSRDGKYILYVQDQGGDENYNVYAVDPAEAPAAGAATPKARNITAAKGARAVIYFIPKTEPDALFVGLNDRDKAWHDLYKVKISTGERTLVRQNNDRVTGWIMDNKAQLRMATRSADNGDTEVLRVDADKMPKIYSCGVLDTCAPLRFDKENKLAWFITNKGDSVDLTELAQMDPATGTLKPYESDPLKRVDFSGTVFSDLTEDLVATTYLDDRVRIYWKNKVFEADYKFLKSKLGDRELGFGSHTADETKWIISSNSDVEPGETYLFDRKTKQLTLQYKIREKLPRTALCPMKPVRFKSSDGLEIPAYLTLPKGVPAQKLPVIMLPHGGPWARDDWGYDPLAQFLANRGYGVLQMNFRGSTGYGKKFLNAGNKEWGQKMQDDITFGAKHLIAEGIADPKRIGILGGSYGGYATLAGVTFTPDVYAAAVSIVGPSNLITLMESIPPYWEAARKIFYVRMGDPNTPEGKKQLLAQSPLTHAAKIKTPLMVVQGANDPRVNKRESDQIVIALRDRGFPVEYLVADDEGHGFARPVNNLAMMAAMEKFLSKFLDGRFQSGATPETTKRLAEITVDPKTVKIAAPVTASASSAPKPDSAPLTGPMAYKVSVQAGTQNFQLEVTSEIKEEGGNWIATDTMKSPMGDAVDITTLAKDTLAPIKRSIKQGPVVIELTYDNGKASGKMTVSGQDRPIAVDLPGSVFADGAGSSQSIAALPLAEGYSAVFLNFDIQKAKAKPMQLKVVGSESVTVPAGTFDAFKVEVAATDGPDKQTLWVAKSPRKVVRIEAVMPQLGGAKMISELLK